MPGQLFTNPSSELNQSRQGSQILASEMDSTLHKATRTRADLKTRTPRTDNGRGDTKGIRTTSTPANPGRPSTARFLTCSAPRPSPLFKPKTPARLCRRRNSGDGPAEDDLTPQNRRFPKSDRETPHPIAAQPTDLDVSATLLHCSPCRNSGSRHQSKFILTKTFRAAHTPPLVDDHAKIYRQVATACRKIAAICRNIEVPGLGITTSGHGRGAPCSGAPGYPKVVLMASFVKIAPPKPEKFPILRLYPHPSRIIGPSQRSYPAAQKTDRTALKTTLLGPTGP